MVYNYIILRFLSCALPFYLIYQHLLVYWFFLFFVSLTEMRKEIQLIFLQI